MGNSAAEAQQFYNSKLADKIQAGRLGESQLGAKNAQANQGQGNERRSGTNANTQAQQQQQESAVQRTTQVQKISVQQQLKSLHKQIKKKEEEIAIAHSELGAFYRMLMTQFIPMIAAGIGTIGDIFTKGILGILIALAVNIVRFVWFIMQSPKIKLWLRIKAMKQMIICGLINLVPFVGTLLQPTLISAVVVTPYQTGKKIRELKVELEQKKKEKKQLVSQQKQLMRQLRTS